MKIPFLTRRGHAESWLLIGGLAGPALLLAGTALATVVTPGYSHLQSTISQLGTTDQPHPEVMNSAFVAAGGLLLAFAWGTRGALAPRAMGITVASLLACYALALVLLGAVPTDNGSFDGPTSADARIHRAAIGVGAIALGMARATIWAWLHRDPGWRGFVRLSAGTLLIEILLAPFVFTGGPTMMGVAQRAIYLLDLVWLWSLAWRLLRLGRTR